MIEPSLDYPTGAVGLTNLGATCYMNATIQMLFHSQIFRNQLMTMDCEEFRANGNEGVIATELQKIFCWFVQEAVLCRTGLEKPNLSDHHQWSCVVCE